MSEALTVAGLVQSRVHQARGQAVLYVDGVELRETKLRAVKPKLSECERVDVLYKGPLSRLSDASGINSFAAYPQQFPSKQPNLSKTALSASSSCSSVAIAAAAVAVRKLADVLRVATNRKSHTAQARQS